MRENSLIISDLQIPFEHANALKFCKAVAKEYKIPTWNVYCVGDETDHYFGSTYLKDPNGYYTANSEIKATLDKLKGWYRAFPMMKLAVSNHGLRWAKKAYEAEIPSQMLRPYQELIESPKGWVWKDEWVVKDKHPWRMIHGMGYSGANGHVNAAIDAGMSTVIGHLHSHPGVNHIQRSGLKIWAANSGSLIDIDAYAFHYGKHARNKPGLGCIVILDSGRFPIWVPVDAY